METLNKAAPKQQKLNRRSAGIYKKQERRAAESVKEEQINDSVKIIQTDSHVQIFFKAKPSEAIRLALKASHFKWYPKLACWQRFKSYHTFNVAKEILKRYQTTWPANQYPKLNQRRLNMSTATKMAIKVTLAVIVVLAEALIKGKK